MNQTSQNGSAAELAMKMHVLALSSDIGAGIVDFDAVAAAVGAAVNLTEAPEDALATLIIDLMQYCEREGIDWEKEVMLAARKHYRQGRGGAGLMRLPP